jgi:nitrogen regulatory protein PII
MRAIVVITDTDAMDELQRAFVEDGTRGFTVLPAASGLGRTGLKAGDRIHPGASSILFSVVRDADLESALDLVRRVRDGAGAREDTKIFVAPIDEVAW